MPNSNTNDLSTLLNKLVIQHALERTRFTAHSTATSHRYEGCQEVRDNTAWTACDTSRALRDLPYDEFLGIKFYHRDPLPSLLRYMQEHPKNDNLFVDHEFPSNQSASLSVDTCTTKGIRNDLLPGILTSSNCRDFASAEEAKRAERIPKYCKMAKNCCWVRRGSKAPLFSELQADNIQQGAIGNCGFCSAFASLVQEWPERIHDAFGKYSEAALANCGACSLKVYPQGKKRYLLLDDHLLRNKAKRKAPSLQSREGDTWIEYLEKAIVKVQGSYASLDGHYKHNSLYRHPARALQLLTGAPLALEIHYNIKSQRNSLQEVYEVLEATQGSFARVAHCRATHENLVSNHGYSLLWIGSTASGQPLVCLRNPHGRCSYRGKYGYGWNWKQQKDGPILKELKQSDFFQKIALGCPITGADNGIFLMEFHVFAQCFPIVTIVGPMDASTGRQSSNNVQGSGEDSATEFIYKSKPASLREIKAQVDVAKSC